MNLLAVTKRLKRQSYESFERTHQEGLDVLVVGDDSVVNHDELYKRKTGNVSHRYLHFVRNYTSTLTESRRNFSKVFLDFTVPQV